MSEGTITIEDVPADVRADLTVHLVSNVAEVLRLALADGPAWTPRDGELERLLVANGSV